MVKIIAIDGLDGSGKSTFCRKYVSYLKDLNLHTRKNEKVYIESFHLPDYETPTGLTNVPVAATPDNQPVSALVAVIFVARDFT